jgi:hypothetical protein
MNNFAPKFTCTECGDHELIVTHIWIIKAGENREHWLKWGPLKDDHHWDFEFKEMAEECTEDEVERCDFGEFEQNDSTSEPEEYETHETGTDRDEDVFFVNCGRCDRELEFGWSQKDCRGLIFPVELSDFLPSNCWPNPKYLDTWKRKGWLQTISHHPE